MVRVSSLIAVEAGRIERLARGSKRTELDIARAALSAGGGAAANDGGIADRSHDPGYHLIGAGRRAFETRVGYRSSLWSSLGRFSSREAGDYIAAIGMIAGIVVALPLIVLHSWGISGYFLVLLALVGLVPSIDAAVALVKARAQRFADTAALFQALGGGWWNRNDALVDSSTTRRSQQAQ